MMKITINGEERTLEGEVTIRALLAQLGLNTRQVAIERNLEIVPKSQYGETLLAEGDRIEVVRFIGGG